ncbi:signal peptidase II [Coralliovum pocilloporae]|uniref:signal peptidase II n=1 Tax=Coralliovum pocilloporae TaxID=3066369 RepID=UPI003307871E
MTSPHPSLFGPYGRLGGLLALFALLTDQGHKYWMLNHYNIEQWGRVRVSSFLDLVLVWNEGISYGLFAQDGDLGRYVLIAVTCLVVIGLWVWLTRAHSRLVAVSLGLVIGGAVGNIIDRIYHGAVADFFYLHIGSFDWYVFNVADVWIVAGVIGLLYDSFFGCHGNAANED